MFISDALADPAPATAAAAAPASPPPVNVAAPPPVNTATTSTGAPEQAQVPSDAPSPLSGMGILLLIPVVLYFLMIRPNQKKIQDFEEMVKALRRGDRVVTGGGIIGVISKIENDDVLVIEIAPEVKVRVMRETISQVITKTAVNDNKAEDKGKKDEKAGG